MGIVLLADNVAGPRYKNSGGHLLVLAALTLVTAPPSRLVFIEMQAGGGGSVHYGPSLRGGPPPVLWREAPSAHGASWRCSRKRIPVALVGRVRARRLCFGAGYDKLLHLLDASNENVRMVPTWQMDGRT